METRNVNGELNTRPNSPYESWVGVEEGWLQMIGGGVGVGQARQQVNNRFFLTRH